MKPLLGFPRDSLLFVAAWLSMVSAARGAGYVIPMMGGGQATAPMVHCDVMFDGTNISLDLQVDPNDPPMLRPLVPPAQFDPAQLWAVLQGKAYNFQYGWNVGGFITLPPGTAIWVQRLHHDNGLEAYLRPPATPAWSAAFTQDGERWKWSGTMVHNAYAVLKPRQVRYEATYSVYIGDAGTGTPVAGYGSATITWAWQVDQCITHVVWADADNDGDVDADDFAVLQTCLSSPGLPYPADVQWCRCFDRGGDGNVDTTDFEAFEKCAAGPAVPWSAALVPDCAP